MAARRLVIQGANFCWSRGHGHVEIDGQRRCFERFSAWMRGLGIEH